MKIEKCLNTTPEDIKDKKHNIWIGISLGNKFFNRENLEKYILGSLKYSKQNVLIVIADEPQAINYQVFDDMKEEKAKAKATRKGDEISELVKDISSEIKVARWKDLICQSNYQLLFRVLKDEYSHNEDFQNKIVKIVDSNLGLKTAGLSMENKIKLGEYILAELPILLTPIELDQIKYNLLIYPDLSDLDYFVIDVQIGKSFPVLTKKLNLKDLSAVAEVYP